MTYQEASNDCADKASKLVTEGKLQAAGLFAIASAIFALTANDERLTGPR
jgi:hypothetical protein